MDSPHAGPRKRALVAGVCSGPHGECSSPARIDPEDGIQLEQLDRGLIALTTSEGAFLSWRLLADEVSGHTETGLDGPDFHVLRDGEKIATVKDSTNYLDEEGDPDSAYSVTPVEGDGPDGEATVWAEDFHDIPCNAPKVVRPQRARVRVHRQRRERGRRERRRPVRVRRQVGPDNSKDVSQVGYTGNTLVDTHTLEGDLLHRIDLGVNIRSGAHYTQFLVHDFDGDGRAELMLKTAPGTRTLTFDEDGRTR